MKENLKGKIKSVTEYFYSPDYSSSEIRNGELISVETNKYNSDGNTTFWSQNIVSRNEGFEVKDTYNDEGKIIESISYKLNGKFDSKYTYEYKNAGRIVITKIFYQIKNYSRIDTKEYDERGNVILEKNKYKGGDSKVEKNKYDDENRIIQRKYYENNRLDRTISYKYNSFGKEILERTIYTNKDWEERITTYDQKGHITEFEWSSNKKSPFDCLYKYKCDENGNELERHHYEPNGKLHCSTLKKFDSKGNEIEIRCIYSEEFEDGLDFCVYDENNNLLEKKEYEGDEFITHTSNKFNEQGELIEDMYHDIKKNIKNVKKYFEFDKNNNWTKSIILINDIPDRIYERVIEYQS